MRYDWNYLYSLILQYVYILKDILMESQDMIESLEALKYFNHHGTKTTHNPKLANKRIDWNVAMLHAKQRGESVDFIKNSC